MQVSRIYVCALQTIPQLHTAFVSSPDVVQKQARQLPLAFPSCSSFLRSAFFLSRWFAYMDVLGSMSNRHEQPLFGAYLEDGGGLWLVNRNDEEIYQIDCFFGFSGRCLALLAQVAEPAAQASPARLDPATNLTRPGLRMSERSPQQRSSSCFCKGALCLR